MNKEQRCAELLEIGINHKRNGEFEKALTYYEKAFNEFPYNKDIYRNCSKIYMAVGQTDQAMRNLLTYAQIIINNGSVNMESYDFAVPFYEWSGSINNTIKVQKNIAILAVTQNFNLAKIVADLNLTFHAGFCFIIKYRNSTPSLQFPANLLNNYVKLLTGLETNGPSLADSEYSTMVRAIGLSYLLVNFITNPNLPIEELIDVYLNQDFKIDNF